MAITVWATREDKNKSKMNNKSSVKWEGLLEYPGQPKTSTDEINIGHGKEQ